VLSSPVGYGKLVVLSSNFAGKEFELSRPQMIIGRTDENDIVVNHRSISRNHAKLTREPETGRYTISDLQSSNGVRVNGQDYGKVELRRGDVVDLGHVRLRFVEAGEDFVFSRDAVITDVPDTSKSKTLLFAVALAVAVVVAIVLFVVMKGGNEKKTKNGSNDMVAEADAGTAVAMGPDSTAAVDEIDAGTSGVAPIDTNDATSLRCREAADKRQWANLIACAEELRKADKDKGDALYKIGHDEQRAEVIFRDFEKAVTTEKSIKKAKEKLDAISAESVYKKDAQAKYDKMHGDAIAELTGRANRAKKDCKDYNTLMRQEASSGTPKDIIDEVKDKVTCTTVAAKDPPPKDPPPKDPPPKDPPEKCNAEELIAKGREAFTGARYSDALTAYDAAYRCKSDANTMKLVFASACRAGAVGKAKSLWKKMPQAMKDATLSFCVGAGITVEKLNEP
jgi:pSer/pThr/pTyr-binding forkhead associated (FHA) protein